MCPHGCLIPFGSCIPSNVSRNFARSVSMFLVSSNVNITIAQIFVCDVTRSTNAEGQTQRHDDVDKCANDLRHEMALEIWIVSVHEKSEQLWTTKRNWKQSVHVHRSVLLTSTSLCLHKLWSTGLFHTSSSKKHFDFLKVERNTPPLTRGFAHLFDLFHVLWNWNVHLCDLFHNLCTRNIHDLRSLPQSE